MRRHDWASRMFAVIDAHIHRDFAFASADCALFVARVVDAMTDSNYEQQLSEVYTDERTAICVIAEQGGMKEAVCAFLGPVAEGRPMRGDVVLIDGGNGDAVGIWDGRHVIAMGETGLHRLSRDEIRAFWAVR